MSLLSRKLERTRQRKHLAEAALSSAVQRGLTREEGIKEAIAAIRADHNITVREARRVIQIAVRSMAPLEIAIDDNGRYPAWVYRLHSGATSRSARGSGAVELTVDDIWQLYTAQEGKCALSGLSFDNSGYAVGSLVSKPFWPSLDRRDSRRGYTKDNVRLVCTIANFALNRWGDDALKRLARAICEHEDKNARASVSGPRE